LENVGPSPRHHTFFEMLGNFSFGDYFKEGAIRFAYDFLTVVCGLPVERLWYTVHTSDDHAFNIWVNEIGVEPERVLRMGDKTNFWMMGDVGPCGPTSEIHWDWGPEACTCGEPNCSVLLDNDCDRWLEVWNLVFMQFNQDEDGTRTPLPKPGVDTGMGLERVVSAVQRTPVNYDNDLFKPAMDQVQALLGDSDEERAEKYVGYRVIGDHGRAATFMIADGVMPGNVGAGYVLRMVIRRAARYGRKIGFTEPFLAQVAQVYIDQMAGAYPELQQRRDHILHTLTLEEERFARTLDRALDYLDELMADLHQEQKTVIPGEAAFNLHATHGLALEITRDVAKERGFTVDEAGFKAAKEAHALASGAGAFEGYQTGTSVYGDVLEMLVKNGRLQPSGIDHDPYSGAEMESNILAILRDGAVVESLSVGDKAEVVTAATPFYVESGGEVSDSGVITLEEGGCLFRVDEAIRPKNVANLILHRG
jgi:alanyl-tRNA synthetase